MTIVLSALIGVITGLRSLTAPAAICWAAYLGRLDVAHTPFAFAGSVYTVGIFTVLALVELVVDQLPTTPSRTQPMGFGARILMGAASGGAIGAAHDMLAVGAVVGIAGAVAGTFGGRAVRGWLAVAFGNDHPAAFLEDAVAVGGALLIVLAL